MPTTRIQEVDLSYDEADIITFDEGLIGFPHLRRMVIVGREDYAPFLWLASLDDPEVAFIVVEPRALFKDYEPRLPEGSPFRNRVSEAETMLVFATVLLAPDWTQSTLNLRAPIFIASPTMHGAQAVLVDSPYRLDEPLPLALNA